MKKILLILALLLLPSLAFAQSQRNPCYYNSFTDPTGHTVGDCNQVGVTTPLPVATSGSNVPVGPMQSQLSITTGATVALTVPTNAIYATISIRQGAASCINYSTDGTTTPTTGATGNGKQLCAGQTVSYSGKYLSNFLAIASTAPIAIDVEYGR